MRSGQLALALLLLVALIACEAGPGPTQPVGSDAAPTPGGAAAAIDSTPNATPGAPGAGAGAGGAGGATAGSAGAGASSDPGAGGTAAAAPRPPTTNLAVVTGFTNYKTNAVTVAQLVAKLKAKAVFVPCGVEDAVAAVLKTARTGWAACVPITGIAAKLGAKSTSLGLLPPGLVTPQNKVVPLGGTDLFGMAPERNRPYGLSIPTPADWKTEWVTYDKDDIRVLLFSGVNCADRGVSRQTIVLKKGWDWMLQAGTARYTGRHWDSRFGWWVVDAARSGNAGAVQRLIQNADIAVSDFECPMSKNWRHHDNGTVFTVDPRVAALMKKAGFDLATIGTDHMTNAGLAGVGDTVDAFDDNGIKHIGGGRTLAAAAKPAVITVRGMRFSFVAWNGAPGSAVATSKSAGVIPLNSATIKSSLAAARKVGDVVIAMPQWSTVEYTASFTSKMVAWRNAMFAAGADHVIGGDTHWAGAISLTPGGTSGNRLAVASQGNFWFGQDWSRQTQEGYMTVMSFAGKRLVGVRLVPTVVLDNAQPNLWNPATDGQFVLNQVFKVSTLKAK